MINLINSLRFKNKKCITSFPKSGQTWVCYVFANLLYEYEDINPTNINKLIPSINNSFFPNKKSKLFRSHLKYEDKNFFKKNIYIIRNPKSVFVSNYYYQIRNKNINHSKNINNFSIDMLFEKNQFGNWETNVSSWLNAPDDKRLIIRYEDLINNGNEEFVKMANYLELDFNKKSIDEAINKSNMNNLKLKEIKYLDKVSRWKNINKSIPFFREGKIDSWKNELDSKTINIIDEQLGYLMREFNYL